VILTIVAAAFCAGMGVTLADAARSAPAARGNTRPVVPHVDPVPARRAALAAAVTFEPKPGAIDVGLDASVVVDAGSGYLETVRVVSAAGVPVAGTFTSVGNRWQSQGPLAPGSVYAVTATVRGWSGVTATPRSTFRTLTPVGNVGATVFPSDGITVGVAQPIVIRFDHFISDPAGRAAALDHFVVTESRPVPGGWYWFSNNELHFRPQEYWPAGEQVMLTSDLNGWNAGNGLWGSGQPSGHFTIGNAHVSLANLATDQMTVTDNGKVVATYPFSGGRMQYPTMNGTHIVLDRESVVHMVSSTNGIPVNSPDGYDELVYSDVHITDSGEYVHAAPWSVNSQGHANVSHGCINLSPADASAFFAFSRVGDVVSVVGGPRPPARGDHGVMDWETTWPDWTPGAVQGLVPPAESTTATAPASLGHAT
jgi:lipoprotein-anchoring transpeptidase ErfK/SrfK